MSPLCNFHSQMCVLWLVNPNIKCALQCWLLGQCLSALLPLFYAPRRDKGLELHKLQLLLFQPAP